jgi:hypothetical protein
MGYRDKPRKLPGRCTKKSRQLPIGAALLSQIPYRATSCHCLVARLKFKDEIRRFSQCLKVLKDNYMQKRDKQHARICMNTYFETRRFRDASPQLVLMKHKVHIYVYI